VNGSGISARNAGQRPGMRDAIEAGMHAYTRPFRAPDGEPLPGTIAESATMRLGGLDQWVMIRGENVSNPPLILLHGGPGMPESPFFRCFNAPLESAFTVVYWDQRGAGKSFDRCIPRSTMTVEQFVADLDELVDEVRTRLGKTKVMMLGHSWGSALGPLYAARFPEKVALYVGAAQIGDWAAGEKLSYAFALAEAERQGNRKMLEKLYAIGPPPHSTNSLFIERTCVVRLEGKMRAGQLWKVGRTALASGESSFLDFVRTMRGFRFSLDAMWPEVSRLNLHQLVPALRMPVVFLLGRKDHWVPPETSVAYFDALTAPSKKLVWFEESSHEMFADESAKFNAVMTELAPSVDT
jgi:pimeloyl-ACP methyl ester carboxylesterase